MSKAFLPLLLKGGDKTMINLASAGAHGITPSGSGYQTTRFALLRFTEYIMVEYGDKGILAYSVHPGGVPSDMSVKMPENVYKASKF
jgi:NAD(P)-dependent dehydrogenase (short-subunit alcohol dehydrogenase family)